VEYKRNWIQHVNRMPGIQEELDTTCKQNAWNARGTGYNM
jgi:hypothetical protein